MPIDLSGARQDRQRAETEERIKSEPGAYRAYWIGQRPLGEVKNRFNDPCRYCKGKLTEKYSDRPCRVCHGTNIQHENRVILSYELENGNVEEEDLNFILSEPDTKVSTYTLRLRALSGFSDNDDIEAWGESLPETPRVPCTVIINDNQRFRKISDVLARKAPPRGANGERPNGNGGNGNDGNGNGNGGNGNRPNGGSAREAVRTEPPQRREPPRRTVSAPVPDTDREFDEIPF